jgi:hypothetical protein
MYSFRKLLCASLAIAMGGLLSAVPARAEDYSWKTVTIGGGGLVSGVVYHPTTPNLMYARTDVGGAYRWDEAGGFWIALNDDIGGLNNAFMDQGVLSIALDPVNDKRVYLAVGQYVQWWAPPAAILSSIDRGATWTKTVLPIKLGGNEDGRTTGERLQVDPNQPRILYLGSTADGVWRSADNAKTWTKLASFPEARTTFVLFDKSSSTYGRPSKTIYVGVKPAIVGDPSLFRSTDSGATWHAVPNQPLGGLIALQAGLGYKAQNVLYVAYSDAIGPNGASKGAVWKLNTTTGAWTNITPPTGQGGFSGVSVGGAGNSPDVVAVSTLDRWWPGDEIYRSTDGGATWKATVQPAILDNSPAPWSVARSPHWTGDVDIDPFNPDRAIFITGYGLWATKDFTNAHANKTVHWTFENEELEETVPLALASPKAGIFHLYSSLGDIGGFRHRYLRGSPPLVDYFNPYRGTTRSIAVAEENSAKIVRTVGETIPGQISTDFGATWKYFATAPAGASSSNPGFIDISADGSRIVWLLNNSAPAYSSDNGATWTPSVGGPAAGTGSFRPVADKVNSNKFYIVRGSNGTLWRSDDGGANFTVATSSLPTSADFPVTVPGLEGNIWVPAWANGLLVSTDSGATFTKLATVQEGYRVGFGKAAEGQTHPAIYIWGKVAGTVGFYRSDDTGATWTRINDDKHQYGYINHMIGDPRVYGRVFLATSGRGIIYGQPVGTQYPDELPDPNDPVFHVPPEKIVYTDAFVAPWGGDGWGFNTLAFNNTTPVHGGTNSIRITFNQNWGIVRMHRSVFNVGNHKNLHIWVHGGTAGGQGIRVIARKVGDVWLNAYNIPKTSVIANTWNEVVIPLTSLGLTPADDIIGFAFGNYGSGVADGVVQPTFYFDNIAVK